MRLLILFIAPVICLFSCQDGIKSETTTATEYLASNETKEEENQDENSIVAEPNTVTDFFIEDMPAEWMHLEKSEETEMKYIIYHYCEAEVATISFQPEKGEDWSIYTGYGQEGQVRGLQNFSAASEGKEGKEIVSGSFDIIDNYSNETKQVTFSWDKESQICEFVGLEYSGGFFIPSDKSDLVEHIEEDCEGLWDE
jgi:hypothetical protein